MKTSAPPLQDVVVLDLTRWLAGPYCTMMLADAGATVIKVEPPEGEINRQLFPVIEAGDGETVSAYFLRLNRRKQSVTLDLRHPDDREDFLDLVRGADVVVENFRPGVMDRLDLGYDVLSAANPRLVMCSISGFGNTPSELRDWPAFNLVAEAMAGLVRVSPETGEPQALGPAIGDLGPALHALSGILMALLRRGVTGEGSYVDVAMLDSCLSLNELAIANAEIADEDFEYGRRINPNLAPYGLFPAADGHVCIAVASEPQWLGFCQALGLSELAQREDLRDGSGRVTHFTDLIEPPMLTWLAERTREQAAKELAAASVPASPVWTSREALATDQARTRGMAEHVVSPGRGNSWPIPATPIRFEPGYDAGPALTPPLGSDNQRYLSRDTTSTTTR
ncbi:CoA transferase [Nocardioides seonyuensis]|uniref:CoA transferase n=1 Tax=Nocardioides seonyuensis TaxID=2518371 RepID=A0A4P7ILZ2_9ACTN|nr:CoA transferase [Nocardioides seonyuensis]QBX57241.1 CoA transferase [Nocardioides seonyuensis]